MRRAGPRQVTLLAVMPFLLLSSSQSVRMRTVAYLDGTVRREIVADFLRDRQSDVLPELRRALPEADQHRLGAAGEGLEATWSVIVGQPQSLQATLQSLDISDLPLSLVSYYTWTETVEIPSDTATAVEKANPSLATFNYEITMPGWIRQAQATPKASPAAETAAQQQTATGAPAATPTPAAPVSNVQPQISGATAKFALSAAYPQYDVTVSSWRLRWGYLLTLLYILGFVAYRIVAFVLHRARLKPKRI